ncbi:MAG TPA: mechanosensitive ion channel domain-containing protein [Balneolales bacterium]|nr:mechanosensitive ion channel domain-containing protein [Balneolales bacterium]
MDLLTDVKVAGNELWRILTLFGLIIVAFIVGRIAKYVFDKSAQKAKNIHKDILSEMFTAFSKSITFLLISIALKAGLAILVISSELDSVVQVCTTILIILSIGYLVYTLTQVVDVWLRRFATKTESKLDDMLAPLVGKSLRVTVVILILLQVAQTLSDKPITSILAGLGVGGLAVALAAQDTIKNFFGSIVLFSDKPFEVGDRINVEGYDGPVEEVGFRSTRIRTLEGHMVSIPNGQLANMTIHNIGKRPYIRRVMTVTVTYDTTPEKMQEAVDILKELLDNHEGLNPDFPPRVYFSDFASTSLDILVIYWYHPPDYWKYMEFSERLNMNILKRFNEAGIDFAFPTQTVYLAGDENRPLNIGWHSDGDEEKTNGEKQKPPFEKPN